MRRRTAVVVMAGAVLAACGGASSPTASSAPASAGDPSRVVQLDTASFDPTVLAATRPSLVEFHSPT